MPDMPKTDGGLTVTSIGEIVLHDNDELANLDDLSTDQLEVYLKWRKAYEAHERNSTVRLYGFFNGDSKQLLLSAEFRVVIGPELDAVREVMPEFARQWGAKTDEWIFNPPPNPDESPEMNIDFDVDLWEYPADVVGELAQVLRAALLQHPVLAPCINHVI